MSHPEQLRRPDRGTRFPWSAALFTLGVSAVTVLLLVGAAPAPRSVPVGVQTGTEPDAREFAQVAGVPMAWEGWYASWSGTPGFDAARASAIAADGALPLLTWEPWDPGSGMVQPEYAMARIAAGDHDAYISAFAGQVKEWGGRLAIRFAHELDAPHYPWSVGVNGNSAADLVAAYRHVRAVFDAVGVTVTWIWCVNVHSADTADYGPLYPGDDVVDLLGIDGYNGGEALPWGGWKSPDDVFADSIADLRSLSDKPILITETASAEAGGDKAAWIRALFGYAASERLAGLIWFQERKEADWRITSSDSAAAAFHDSARRHL
jgi:hypothetical protein